jgi:hypothetical protein
MHGGEGSITYYALRNVLSSGESLVVLGSSLGLVLVNLEEAVSCSS